MFTRTEGKEVRRRSLPGEEMYRSPERPGLSQISAAVRSHTRHAGCYAPVCKRDGRRAFQLAEQNENLDIKTLGHLEEREEELQQQATGRDQR